jgi:hypothetical protein
MKEKSNNKQASVDQLFDQLSSENLLGLFTHDQMKRAMEILEQAKSMHKEEIMDAFDKGCDIGCDIGSNYDYHDGHNQGYDYYEQTYGGNNGNNNSN